MINFLELRKKFNDFIFKNINHVAGILIISILSTILFYRNFIENGQLLYVDMTFPNSLDRIFEFYSNTWNPYGGFSLVPLTLYRMPWIMLTLIPAIIFNINIDDYILFLFIFTFFIAGLSSYLLTYYIVRIYDNKNNQNNKDNEIYDRNRKFIISIGSCITAIIYMYNPISLGFFWAYGFYPTYALLPIILLLIIKSFVDRKSIYPYITAIFMMLASTSIHGIIWIFIILIYSFIFFTFVNFDLKKFLFNSKMIAIISILYLVLMSFWIFPTIFIVINGGSTQPPYNFKESMLNKFSSTSSLDNSFRLLSGTRFLISPEFIGLNISKERIPIITSSLSYKSITNPSSVDNPFWIVFSYIIPILVAASLILYRSSPLKKMVRFFIILSIISIFLNLGTNSPFPYIYKWLALDAPWSEDLGWMFRVPYRLLIFATLGFSVLCGLTIFKILEIGIENKKKNRFITNMCIATIIFSLIGITYFFFPVTKAHADYIFSPTKLPEEYNDLNNWLKNQNGDYKVLWLPKYPSSGYFPSWAPYKRIGPINIESSEKESFSNFFNARFEKYFVLIDKSLKNNKEKNIGNIEDMLTPLGIRYVILDNSMKGDPGLKYNLDNASGIRLAFNKNFIYVYENINFTSPVNIVRNIDNSGLKNINYIFKKKERKEIYYEKINHERYAMQVNEKNPFMLSFAESYDPLWRAYIYKHDKYIISIKPVPLYSIINGFWINETGDIKIEVKYTPQGWFEFGLIISIFALIFCLGNIFYDIRHRNKKS